MENKERTNKKAESSSSSTYLLHHLHQHSRATVVTSTSLLRHRPDLSFPIDASSRPCPHLNYQCPIKVWIFLPPFRQTPTSIKVKSKRSNHHSRFKSRRSPDSQYPTPPTTTSVTPNISFHNRVTTIVFLFEIFLSDLINCLALILPSSSFSNRAPPRSFAMALVPLHKLQQSFITPTIFPFFSKASPLHYAIVHSPQLVSKAHDRPINRRPRLRPIFNLVMTSRRIQIKFGFC